MIYGIKDFIKRFFKQFNKEKLSYLNYFMNFLKLKKYIFISSFKFLL